MPRTRPVLVGAISVVNIAPESVPNRRMSMMRPQTAQLRRGLAFSRGPGALIFHNALIRSHIDSIPSTMVVTGRRTFRKPRETAKAEASSSFMRLAGNRRSEVANLRGGHRKDCANVQRQEDSSILAKIQAMMRRRRRRAIVVQQFIAMTNVEKTAEQSVTPHCGGIKGESKVCYNSKFSIG